jgi:DNA-binding LacI/PurR family transcriptional regulator
MEKANKNSSTPLRCTYLLIARKLGCHPKYVSRVLNGKLGKYNDRDTDLVKKIRETAEEVNKMFSPDKEAK